MENASISIFHSEYDANVLIFIDLLDDLNYEFSTCLRECFWEYGQR